MPCPDLSLTYPCAFPCMQLAHDAVTKTGEVVEAAGGSIKAAAPAPGAANVEGIPANRSPGVPAGPGAEEGQKGVGGQPKEGGGDPVEGAGPTSSLGE